MRQAPVGYDRIAELIDEAEQLDATKPLNRDTDFRIAIVYDHCEVLRSFTVSKYSEIVRLSRELELLGWQCFLAPKLPALQEFDFVFAAEISDAAESLRAGGKKSAGGACLTPARTSGEDLYRLVTQHLPAGAAFVVDHDLRYQLAEGQSLRDAGLKPQNVQGMTVFELLSGRYAAQVAQDYRSALAGGTFSREHAVGTRWFFTHGMPLQDSQGRIYAALAVSYDVTPLKQAQLSLETARSAFDELSRKKDLFLATLAHELRTPLAPISVGLEVLRRLPVDSEKTQRTYAMLHEQISQISRLIEDLLDVAKIAEGKLRVNDEAVNVQDAVRVAVDASLPHLTARCHELRIAVPDFPIGMRGDPGRVAQILANLMNNAAKFTQPGGRIQLNVEESGNWIEFRVSDNGCGFEAATAGQMFNMFEQLPVQNGQDSRAGLGVGLALVRSLVELHGGTVAAYSDGPGCGSTFTVRLPKSFIPDPPLAAEH